MKSANGDSCVQELSDMKESIFSTDVCMDKLENQLRIVVDVIRVERPEVKKVTSIRTICDAMAQHVNKDLLSEVHLLLRLYLTFPITSSTSERSFSALRRLFTYLRSSMSENRLKPMFLVACSQRADRNPECERDSARVHCNKRRTNEILWQILNNLQVYLI